MRLEAVVAVDRLVAARLERNFRLLPAAAAGHAVHLARAAPAGVAASVRAAGVAAVPAAALARVLARGAAVGAAVRLVLEALRREELLFAGREEELRTAVGAGQPFIGIQSSRLLRVAWFRLAEYLVW